MEQSWFHEVHLHERENIMKNFKKTILAMLCMGVIFSMTACGSNDNGSGDGASGSQNNSVTEGTNNNADNNSTGNDDMNNDSGNDTSGTTDNRSTNYDDGGVIDDIGNAVGDGIDDIGNGVKDITDDVTGNGDNTVNNNDMNRS